MESNSNPDIEAFLKAPNYYKALDLDPRSATLKQIQDSYKRLAKIFHPDKNKDPKAHEAIQKLNEIKETLYNDEKRAAYNKKTFPARRTVRRVKSMPIHSYKYQDIQDNLNAFFEMEEKQKAKEKKPKNVLLPLIAVCLVVIILMFISNTEPQTNLITKEALSKVISFERQDFLDFTEYRSKILGKEFFVNKDWERQYIYASDRADWGKLREQLCSIADDIYIDFLKNECQKEQESSYLSSPHCRELRILQV